MLGFKKSVVKDHVAPLLFDRARPGAHLTSKVALKADVVTPGQERAMEMRDLGRDKDRHPENNDKRDRSTTGLPSNVCLPVSSI